MKRQSAALFTAAIVFQCLILTGMVAVAALPLWTGSDLNVRTEPVDPRSLFRGNYARLRYAFSRIDSQEFAGSEPLRNGEVVYVLLRERDGLHEYAGASLTPPANGPYLRGRVQSRVYEEDSEAYRVRYGIEAFFAPKEKALALEKQLREAAIAQLAVSDSGQARLKAVVASP